MAFVNGTKIVALYDDNGRLSGANSEQPNRIAIGRVHSGFLENRKGGLYRIAWKSCHDAFGLTPRLLSPNTCVPLGEGARMTNTAGIPGDRICSFIERLEHIDEEIKALNEGKKEVFAEAKGEGFDVKILKEILRLRKQDKDERDEQDSLLDLYLKAMESADSSQAKAA
jgi:uncharacterized protein (UPF0335 family)